MGRIGHHVQPGFIWLLPSILALYSVVIGLGDSRTTAFLRLGLLALLLVASLRLRVLPWPATAAIGATAVLAGGISLWLGTPALRSAVVGASSVLIIGTTIVVIVVSLVRRRVVDLTTVLGVLCGYLLLALFFAGLHQALGAYSTNYLDGTPNPATPADLLYFSVITLATVGFGDITPASSAARAVTVVEALIGQLYLVSVVAGVVGSARRAPQ